MKLKKQSKTYSKGILKEAETYSLLADISFLTENGVPLSDALNVTIETISGKQKVGALHLKKYLESGWLFHKSISEISKGISPLHLSMILLAEKTGNLSGALSEVVKDFQETKRIRKNIIQEISYPIIVLVLALFLVLIVFDILLPVILSGVKLEGGLVISIISYLSGNLYKVYLVVLFLILFTAVIYLWVFKKNGNKEIGMKMLTVENSIPWVRLSKSLRFYNVMSIGSNAGLSIDTLMAIVKESQLNSWEKIEADEAMDSIYSGKSISKSLSRIGFMSRQDLLIMRYAENAGRLDQAFQTLHSVKLNQIEAATKFFAKVAGPALISVVGLIVSLIAYVILTPMMQIGAEIKL